MKYSNAQVARHLGVKETDLMHVVERPESGQLVVILSDMRKIVFPVTALKEDPRPVEPPPGDPAPLPVEPPPGDPAPLPVEPPPGDPAPLPVSVSGKVTPRK